MQISSVNTNFPIQSNYKNNCNNKNISSINNTSFKGVDNSCLALSTMIENGGFKVSFLIVDMLGTVIPRIAEGAMRNQDENNGELNYRFAAKEAAREITSGPSIFIVPFVIDKCSQDYLSKFSDVFGKSSGISADFIRAFGEIHAQNAVKNGKVASKEEFFKNTFCVILKNAKGELTITAATEKEARSFAQTLYAASQSKKKGALVSAIDSLSSKFVNISKANAVDGVHTDFTVAKVSDKASSSFRKATQNMVDFADDVVEKASKQSAENAKNFTVELVDKKIIARAGHNIVKYGAVIGVFQLIPKFYNLVEGDENAGLKGLMKQETLGDNNVNNNSDKSNPSFGAGSSFSKSITGDGFFSKFLRNMEFDGCSMSFPQLAFFMLSAILYPRIKNARDEYDREEIIRRDVVTCAAMCAGEKILRHAFSKINEVKSGFVLATKGIDFKRKNIFRRVLDYLNPMNGIQMLSSEQIRAKYTNIGNYKKGIVGFCDFISEQGGNLSKLFSIDKTSKSIVEKLLKKEGKDLASADNITITKVLEKNMHSKDVKKLTALFYETKRTKKANPSWLDKILGQTENVDDNPWVKKARTLNARFTALSVLVLVPAFLGFMLPAINERATKKRIAKLQASKKEVPLSNQPQESNNKNNRQTGIITIKPKKSNVLQKSNNQNNWQTEIITAKPKKKAFIVKNTNDVFADMQKYTS